MVLELVLVLAPATKDLSLPIFETLIDRARL
jgi:hypothetical protein